MTDKCKKTVRQWDDGTYINITLVDCDGAAIDISEQNTELFVFLLKPDETSVERAGIATTDGLDGKFRYKIDGEFDQLGDYEVQGYASNSQGAWYSTIDTFTCVKNIKKKD